MTGRSSPLPDAGRSQLMEMPRPHSYAVLCADTCDGLPCDGMAPHASGHWTVSSTVPRLGGAAGRDRRGFAGSPHAACIGSRVGTSRLVVVGKGIAPLARP